MLPGDDMQSRDPHSSVEAGGASLLSGHDPAEVGERNG